MHQLFCQTCQAVGWSAGGEVPLHPKNERGTVTGNSGRDPGNPHLGPAAPNHVADLYDEACGNCSSSAKRQELAQLLWIIVTSSAMETET